MKCTLYLVCLFSLGPLFTAGHASSAERLESDRLLRGSCFATHANGRNQLPSLYARPVAMGGVSGCGSKVAGIGLSLCESDGRLFRDRFDAILLSLSNGTPKPLNLESVDYQLNIIQQALEPGGTWRDIEYLSRSWCGNSYFNISLPPNHRFDFVVPKYHGPIETQLRFKLDYGGIYYYSETYTGGIHPTQFERGTGCPIGLGDLKKDN